MDEGEKTGTHISDPPVMMTAGKRWREDHLRTAGKLVLEVGAVQKLAREGKALLPIGVVGVAGEFGRGDVVTCVDGEGRVVARGICNYPSAEVRRILRKPSSEISAILGYVDEDELIHRDNLVLL